jgi:hypothetical protein
MAADWTTAALVQFERRPRMDPRLRGGRGRIVLRAAELYYKRIRTPTLKLTRRLVSARAAKLTLNYTADPGGHRAVLESSAEPNLLQALRRKPDRNHRGKPGMAARRTLRLLRLSHGIGLGRHRPPTAQSFVMTDIWSMPTISRPARSNCRPACRHDGTEPRSRYRSKLLAAGVFSKARTAPILVRRRTDHEDARGARPRAGRVPQRAYVHLPIRHPPTKACHPARTLCCERCRTLGGRLVWNSRTPPKLGHP